MNLEEIKEKKIKELQRKQRVQDAKKKFTHQALTKKARERLNFLRLTKPGLVEQIENTVILAFQQGELSGKITDEQIKKILLQIQESKKEPKITRK